VTMRLPHAPRRLLPFCRHNTTQELGIPATAASTSMQLPDSGNHTTADSTLFTVRLPHCCLPPQLLPLQLLPPHAMLHPW
jgi:hypothetical protein